MILIKMISVAVILSAFISSEVFADVVVGDSIVKEETGIFSDSFLTPNEFHPHLWATDFANAPIGALLTVGTLRAFIGAAYGPFTKILIVDVNNNATRFNQAHARLIAEINGLDIPPGHQRYQYLAALQRRWFSSENLEALSKFEFEERNPHKTTAAIFSMIAMNTNGPPKDIATLVDNMKKISPRDLDIQYMSMVAQDATPYYWEDNMLWLNLARLAVKGNIYAMTGSFTGESVIPSLGVALAALKEEITIIDFSNVHTHLYRDGLRGDVTGAENNDTLIKNLALLPAHKDAMFLFTVARNVLSPDIDLTSKLRWDYFSFTQKEHLIALARDRILDSESNYRNFLIDTFVGRGSKIAE